VRLKLETLRGKLNHRQRLDSRKQSFATVCFGFATGL